MENNTKWMQTCLYILIFYYMRNWTYYVTNLGLLTQFLLGNGSWNTMLMFLLNLCYGNYGFWGVCVSLINCVVLALYLNWEKITLHYLLIKKIAKIAEKTKEPSEQMKKMLAINMFVNLVIQKYTNMCSKSNDMINDTYDKITKNIYVAKCLVYFNFINEYINTLFTLIKLEAFKFHIYLLNFVFYQNICNKFSSVYENVNEINSLKNESTTQENKQEQQNEQNGEQIKNLGSIMDTFENLMSNPNMMAMMNNPMMQNMAQNENMGNIGDMQKMLSDPTMASLFNSPFMKDMKEPDMKALAEFQKIMGGQDNGKKVVPKRKAGGRPSKEVIEKLAERVKLQADNN